ncbi:MAG: GAF domain-containing protein [Burkholderiales bacterium]|nr:GAF domain-containing protein [Burkholderiales bacterium]
MNRFKLDLLQGLVLYAPVFRVLAVCLSLLVGWLTAGLYQRSDEIDLRHLLTTLAQRHAVQLSEEVLRGRAMGAAAMLGINEPVLKALVQGRLAPDAPQLLERLEPVRRALDAESIAVMDASGRVLAQAPRHSASIGQQRQDMPYWQQAFAGQENVYPLAEGELPPRRSFLLAAPIYAQAQRGGLVVGVLAIKLSAESLDTSLRRLGEHALLLSPQGLVYASSDDAWNFSLAREIAADQLAGLATQFGPTFTAGARPPQLPFDPSQDAVELLGVRHLRVRASLQWPDAAGRWQLLLLASPSHQMSLLGRALVGVISGLLVLTLLLLLLRAAHNQLAGRAALARSEAASRELMQLAQFKQRQSELSLQLQHARELPALTLALFAEIGRYLPVHQGCLYCVEPDPAGQPELHLAGSYATASAPERVVIGDGLLGQCARERRSLTFSEVPAGFWTLESGLGQALPRALLLLPIMRNEVLIGVLELASMEPDGDRIEAMLEGLLPVLATNLEVLLAERRLERLLAEARAQARTDPAPVDGRADLDYAGTDKPGAVAVCQAPGIE